jgi:KDO2-lipid IV(A) lauroyltransferase
MERRSPLAKLAGALRIDGVWLRRLAYLGSAHAPEWFKRSAPHLVAALTFALVKERRRGAVANMERVLGADRFTAHWAALRMYSEFAFCTSETMEDYSGRGAHMQIDPPPEDAVLDAIAAGRGAIVVTGHIGSWDIAAKGLRNKQCQVHVVMGSELDPATQEFVETARARAGVNVILSNASVFSSLGLVRALRRNEIVAIQLDRAARAGGVRMLPFLGAPAPFPSGPFVLARLAGSPVIPVFAPRLGRRHYGLHIGRPVAVPRTARDPLVLDRVMLDVVAQLEEVVRRYPWQWFQFAPFWPEPAAALAPGAEAPSSSAGRS